MPRKKKTTFTMSKRGREGRRGRGYGRGGWLGRVVDLEVNVQKYTDVSNYASQSPAQHTLKVDLSKDSEESAGSSCSPSSFKSLWDSKLCIAEELSLPTRSEDIKMEEIEIPCDNSIASTSLDFLHLSEELQSKIMCFLPEHWLCVCSSHGVSVLLLSRDIEMTTQRRVFVSFMGNVTVNVHRKMLREEVTQKILGSNQILPLSESSLDDFVNRVISVVNAIRKFEVCVGCNSKEYKCLWTCNRLGVVDRNPYGETRYTETFRSHACHLLIVSSKWRCMKCYYLSEILKKKYKTYCTDGKLNTPNIHLSEAQKAKKLCKLQKNLEVSKRLICRLKSKVERANESQAAADNGAENDHTS